MADAGTYVVAARHDEPPDLPHLAGQVRALLAHRELVVTVDLAELPHADLTTVDALARLQLAARHAGTELRLRNPPAELRRLLALTGLRDVVPKDAGLLVEPLGQSEPGEQRGVEERVDVNDPAG